jgi:hypothetical protein
MTPSTEPTSADARPDGVTDHDEVAVALQSADVLAAYRAARDVVPEGEAPRAETRAAILAAAARAVDARPQPVGGEGVARPSGARYWLRLPLALAASLLVGTVAWQLAAQFDALPSSEQVASAPAALPASVPARTPSPPTSPTAPTGTPPLARAASDDNAALKAASVAAAPVPPEASAPAAMARSSAPGLASVQDRDAAARRQNGSEVQARSQASLAAPASGAAADAAPLGNEAQRKRSSNVADPPSRTVGAWLERIAELRRGGRDVDADAEIRALRLAYPEAQIPPALLLPLPR